MSVTRDPALDTFLAESAELLSAMEAVLLRCEQGGADPEAIHELFRAAHTIKGSAGLFGLQSIVSFTHVVESVLDSARTGRAPISAAAAAILLECTDHIGSLRDAIGREEAEDPALAQAGTQLLERLTAETGFVPAEKGSKAAAVAAKFPPAGTTAAPAPAEATPSAATEDWHVSVRFRAGVLQNGMDPLSFVRYLTTFGRIKGLSIVDQALPAAEDYDPELCYIGFEMRFSTEVDQARIEAAFEFVREDSTLCVLAPRAPLAAYGV